MAPLSRVLVRSAARVWVDILQEPSPEFAAVHSARSSADMQQKTHVRPTVVCSTKAWSRFPPSSAVAGATWTTCSLEIYLTPFVAGAIVGLAAAGEGAAEAEDEGAGEGD